MDNPEERALLIYSKTAGLVLGLIFPRLVALDILLEVTPFDQEPDFIL